MARGSQEQEWLNFFLDAGIPDENAAMYARTFISNRIKTSMLLDLDKDYLKDMEITLMGDIINILKHARVVANKNTSDMVLSDKIRRLKNIPESLKPMQIKSSDSSPEPSKRIVAGTSISSRTSSKSTSDTSSSSSPLPAARMTVAATKSAISGDIAKKPPITVVKVKSVFSRLGNQESEEEEYAEKKPVVVKPDLSPVGPKKTLVVKAPKKMDSSSDEEYGPKALPTVRKEDRPSIFDRLEKVVVSAPVNRNPHRIVTAKQEQPKEERLLPASTQEPSVSSSTSDREYQVPNKGILKQRGAAPLQRSKSASNIISLKAPQVEKKKIRVSFGENEVRSMSPRAAAEPGSAHSRLGLLLPVVAGGQAASTAPRAAATAGVKMTAKIQKVAVGGGKFEMRRILVPVAKATTSGDSVSMTSEGILAAETRLAATTSATTVKLTTIKRSLSAVADKKSGTQKITLSPTKFANIRRTLVNDAAPAAAASRRPPSDDEDMEPQRQAVAKRRYEEEQSAAAKPRMNKRIILVRTRADGTKYREELTPDDPRWDEYHRKALARSTSAPELQPRPVKAEVRVQPAVSLGRSLYASRKDSSSDEESSQSFQTLASKASQLQVRQSRITLSESSGERLPANSAQHRRLPLTARVSSPPPPRYDDDEEDYLSMRGYVAAKSSYDSMQGAGGTMRADERSRRLEERLERIDFHSDSRREEPISKYRQRSRSPLPMRDYSAIASGSRRQYDESLPPRLHSYDDESSPLRRSYDDVSSASGIYARLGPTPRI